MSLPNIKMTADKAFTSIAARLRQNIYIALTAIVLLAGGFSVYVLLVNDAQNRITNLWQQDGNAIHFDRLVRTTTGKYWQILFTKRLDLIPEALARNEDILLRYEVLKNVGDVGLRDIAHQVVENEPVILDLRNNFYKLAAAMRRGDEDTANAIYNESIRYNQLHINRLIEDLIYAIDQAIIEKQDDIAALKLRLTFITGSIVLLALILLYISVRKTTRMIVKPILHLTSVIKQTGDDVERSVLDLDQVVTSNDELGLLVESFQDMQQSLIKAQSKLTRQERLSALGQIAGTISHELRNPLGTIRTSVYNLRDKLDVKALGIERTINRIDRNIVRCDKIVASLLDFVRTRELKKDITRLDDWLVDALDELEVPAGITIKREIESKVEIAIDRERFRRAVINVYENACQAMQEADSQDKERILSVKTRARDERIEILIKDTGNGIASDEIEHLFEPLYSTKTYGVGLGLPTVRQIMEQHGGGVEIISEMGKGTHVLLWLEYSD